MYVRYEFVLGLISVGEFPSIGIDLYEVRTTHK